MATSGASSRRRGAPRRSTRRSRRRRARHPLGRRRGERPDGRYVDAPGGVAAGFLLLVRATRSSTWRPSARSCSTAPRLAADRDRRHIELVAEPYRHVADGVGEVQLSPVRGCRPVEDVEAFHVLEVERARGRHPAATRRHDGAVAAPRWRQHTSLIDPETAPADPLLGRRQGHHRERDRHRPFPETEQVDEHHGEGHGIRDIGLVANGPHCRHKARNGPNGA